MSIHPMWNQLVQAITSKKLASVYTDLSDPEHCAVGFIENITEEHFLMKHVTSEGLEDGFVVGRINDVFRIDQHTKYEQRLEILYNALDQEHTSLRFDYDNIGENLGLEVLRRAKANNKIVCIQISDGENGNVDWVNGFVSSVSKETATISKVSYFGEKDGLTTIFLDAIEVISYDTTDEKALKILYQHVNG